MSLGGAVKREATIWRRRGLGFVSAAPGLVVPVAGIAREVVAYASLPAWLKALDGDPMSYRTWLELALVVFLLSCLPPLLVALPVCLRPWHCVAAMGLQLVPLCVALAYAVLDEASWGWVAFALLLYVPALMVYRLVRTSRLGGHRPAMDGALRGGTEGCT